MLENAWEIVETAWKEKQQETKQRKRESWSPEKVLDSRIPSFPNAHAFAHVHLHVRMDKYRIVGVLVAVDIRTSRHTRFFVACGVGHLTSLGEGDAV